MNGLAGVVNKNFPMSGKAANGEIFLTASFAQVAVIVIVMVLNISLKIVYKAYYSKLEFEFRIYNVAFRKCKPVLG